MAPPVSWGYLSQGPLTSTAKTLTRREARSVSTTSGRMPLVSSFTGSPTRPRSANIEAMSRFRVGSPPVTVTPSSHILRRSRYDMIRSRPMAGKRSGLQAIPPL